MESAALSSRSTPQTNGPIPVPKFVVELEPRLPAFFGNLAYLVVPGRPTPLWVTSKPAKFWPDVFISDRLPVRGLFDSVAGHILVLVSIYALAYFGFFGSRPQQLQNPLHRTISYYSVAEYLPEVNSESRPSKVDLKGQPAYAKQEIISVPAEPDNTRQTIVTPWEMKLKHDTPLPNIVAWNPNLPSVPLSATPGKKIMLPPQPDVVAPAPEPVTREGALHMPNELMRVTAVAPAIDPVDQVRRKNQLTSQPEVVAPAVDPLVRGGADLARLQAQPNVVGPAADVAHKPLHATAVTPSVVEPAADPNQAKRAPGTMNIGRLAPEIASPKLAVVEQRAIQAVNSGGTPGGGAPSSKMASGQAPQSGNAGASAATPPANIEGLGNGRSSGQLIALSVEPADVKGPIEIPAGNRRGVFAASPKGTPGAPGTPDRHKGSDGAGGTSPAGAHGMGNGKSPVPEGIYVGPGAKDTPPGPVVASKPSPDPSFRDRLMAAARAPDIPRQPSAGSTVSPASVVTPGTHPIEDKVFGSKRYYSLTLNMPNLASTTGSWIIRFAELKQSHDEVAIAAPTVLTKVDPAYPAELIRDKVEGTVVLYAVIHSDGSIGQIKVLSGVEDRLDANAAKALAAWKFQPGTKNGQPIDLEAVVQIPFRVRRLSF